MANYGLHHYQDMRDDARQALDLDPNDRTALALMRLTENISSLPSLDSLRARLATDIQREYNGISQELSQATEQNTQPSSPFGPSGDETRRSASTAEVPIATPVYGKLVFSAASRLAVKDYQGAMEDASRAIAANPNDRAAYYYRAAAESLLGLYANAVRDASRSIILNPGDAAAHDSAPGPKTTWDSIGTRFRTLTTPWN